jgi:hypothetical protein
VGSHAAEYAEHGIRVCGVAPGGTEAPPRRIPRNTAPPSAENDSWMREVVEQTVASSLMKRYGTTAEQAAAILFLASDEASYITGITLPVAGGDLGCAAWAAGRHGGASSSDARASRGVMAYRQRRKSGLSQRKNRSLICAAERYGQGATSFQAAQNLPFHHERPSQEPNSHEYEKLYEDPVLGILVQGVRVTAQKIADTGLGRVGLLQWPKRCNGNTPL